MVSLILSDLYACASATVYSYQRTLFSTNTINYTDTEVASESVCINGELILSRLNSKEVSIRAFFPQGQSRLSAIMRCP